MATSSAEDSSYFQTLDKNDQVKYKKKLTLENGIELRDPYAIKDGWKDDLQLVPHISWGDIYNYLVNTPSEYTHENLKAYKSLEAFNFFVCNHVQDVFYHELSLEFCCIKTKVSSCVFRGIAKNNRQVGPDIYEEVLIMYKLIKFLSFLTSYLSISLTLATPLVFLLFLQLFNYLVLVN